MSLHYCVNMRYVYILFHILTVTDSRIFLCDFHREQAWLQWVSSANNNMREKKEECANMSSLKDSDMWNDAKSKGCQNWIVDNWLPKYEVF